MGNKSRSAGVHVTYSPAVDLVRDSRWGRVLESTGEDSQLNSDFAKAMVTGMQQETENGLDGIASCVKHFAAYGAVEAGREYNTVDMSERRLREDYLSGYHSAVKAGSKLVMTSFNTYDGFPVAGSKFLLKDILRNEWGFEGVIISDYAAVLELITHGVAKDEKEATNDIDMKTSCYANQLEPLIKNGEIDSDLINDAVWRVLKLKNDLDLFEDPHRGATEENEKEAILTDESRNLAREVSEEAIVLLQNNENILPLQPNKNKILLVGPYGDSQNLIGLWALHGETKDIVTIKSAIKGKVDAHLFNFEPGCEMLSDYSFLGDFGLSKEQIKAASLSESQKEELLNAALKAGEEADVIIFAMGEDTMQSGEAGSRTDITLPKIQRVFIKEMTKLGKKNILVSISGRPLAFTEEVEQMDAIIHAWFPGTEGGAAIANILFGEVNPSGRLSISFPRNVGQLPMYYNHFSTGRPLGSETHSGRFISKYLDSPNTPLFPFGYGLSYSEVTYENLSLSTKKMTDELTVTVEVTNTSDVAVKETIQLYTQDVIGSVVRPVKELKQYKKVVLAPKESIEVKFLIKREDLYYYTQSMAFNVETGDFNVFVGKNSQENLMASFELV